MGIKHLSVKARHGSWIVRLTTDSGTIHQYRYATEHQARYFAAVFRLNPPFLPPGAELVTPVRARRNRQRPVASAAI